MCEYQWCCLHLCKSKSKKQGPRDSSAASDVEKNETFTSAKSLMWYSTISSRICVEKVLGSCHILRDDCTTVVETDTKGMWKWHDATSLFCTCIYCSLSAFVNKMRFVMLIAVPRLPWNCTVSIWVIQARIWSSLEQFRQNHGKISSCTAELAVILCYWGDVAEKES